MKKLSLLDYAQQWTPVLHVYVHVIFMSTLISHDAIHEMQETESQKSKRVFMSFVTCVDTYFGSLLGEK